MTAGGQSGAPPSYTQAATVQPSGDGSKTPVAAQYDGYVGQVPASGASGPYAYGANNAPQAYGGQPGNYYVASPLQTPGGAPQQAFNGYYGASDQGYYPGQQGPPQVVVVQHAPHNGLYTVDRREKDYFLAICMFVAGVAFFPLILAFMPCLFRQSPDARVRKLAKLGGIVFLVYLIIFVALYFFVWGGYRY